MHMISPVWIGQGLLYICLSDTQDGSSILFTTFGGREYAKLCTGSYATTEVTPGQFSEAELLH